MRDPVLKFRQLRILCQDGAREFSWGEMEKTFEPRSSKDRGSLTAAGNTYKTLDNAVRSLQGGVKERLRSLGTISNRRLAITEGIKRSLLYLAKAFSPFSVFPFVASFPHFPLSP